MIFVAKFYITTAIPYVNAKPHLGHALEFVQADAIYRYHQLSGFQAFLTTGADENSLKNVQAAEEEGITPAQLCERNAEKFRQLARDLPLSSDSFLRSSASRAHWQGVHKLWKLCEKSGDIYKKTYRGLYCVGCEAFYTESELKDGLCPEHRKRPELVEEENYFFRLSKYQKQLERLIKTGRLKIIPEGRKNEALAFIKSGLEDFSISRSRKRAKGWGVPVPGDNEQIIYVWIDALAIYLTAIGYGKDGLFKRLWPADLHVIGKGILRFHAIYWPAILLSACLPLPKALFVHGYITTEGQKMSKSLGNMLDPQELISRYGSERLRYYLLKEISPFEDGDFSERAFMEKTNAELVDNFSNLFYRVTTFIEKNFHGRVPKGNLGASEKQLKGFANEKIRQYKESFESFRLNDALSHAMELSSEINRYFQQAEPWETVKSTNRKDKAAATLSAAANALNIVCTLLYPFLPKTSEKASKLLNSKINLTNEFAIKPGTKIKSEMLFKRI